VTIESRSPRLLGRCPRQLRKNCASANMAYSRAERVLILEHYFTSKLFAAVTLYSYICPCLYMSIHLSPVKSVIWLLTFVNGRDLPTQSLPFEETHAARLHVKCPLVLSEFDHNWNVSTDVSKLSSIKFRKHSVNCFRAVTSVQTDRRTCSRFNKRSAGLGTGQKIKSICLSPIS
jgi:hypothetical protein